MPKHSILIAGLVLALATVAPAAAETPFRAYLTAYTYWDNTPPGSAEISHPVVHKRAGGRGTYDDPVTLATGHSLATGKDVLDYAPGTILYVPDLAHYFVVEDTCGDSPVPERGPCHLNIDEPGVPQLDMWIGGARGTQLRADACAQQITLIYDVIADPKPDYPVRAGEIYKTEC
ncbi:MAG: hypothetical protein ABL879_15690 [Devosia sp.]